MVGVLRLDPALIRGQLHPGTRDPGGNWHTPNVITASARNRLAMAFNGGFRLTDPSQPGDESEGRTAAPWSQGRPASSCAPPAPPMSASGTRKSG